MGATLGKLVCNSVLYVPELFGAFFVLAGYAFKTVVLRIPVSAPGGPRKKPLTRKAKWPNNASMSTPGIKFACDKESHEITNKEFPKHKLTGESCGRQIWYKDSSVNPDDAVRDRLFKRNTPEQLRKLIG